MWGGSSRVVALFPGEWGLKGVMATVEEVTRGQPFTKWLYVHGTKYSSVAAHEQLS